MKNSRWVWVSVVVVAAALYLRHWVKVREVDDPVPVHSRPAVAASDQPGPMATALTPSNSSSQRPTETTSTAPSAASNLYLSTVAESPPATLVSLPVNPRQDEEVSGTYRMYLAHAPLRDPSVSDPDSLENRQILETMIRKGLRTDSAQPVTP